jgi:hypothetical protein
MAPQEVHVFAVAARVKDAIELRYIVATDEKQAVISTGSRLVQKHGHAPEDVTVLAATMLPDVVTNAEGSDGRSYSIRVVIFDNAR